MTLFIEVSFDVTTTDYDPERFARVIEHINDHLPPGSQMMDAHSAAEGNPAGFVVRVPDPAGGVAWALHSVLQALELALTKEPAGLDSLQEIRSVTISRRYAA